MPNFDEYLMRHSEHGILYTLEQIEHLEGIRYPTSVSLEDRWNSLMQPSNKIEQWSDA